MTQRHLLDLNVLIALAEPAHLHHHQAHQWFDASGKSGWAVCPLTQSGFLRITTNPAFQPAPRSMSQAVALIEMIETLPGYSFWPIADSWVTLTAPFAGRISGHLQVTDAYLLGLAIQKKAVLVTFDKAIERLAGARFTQNVLVLQ